MFASRETEPKETQRFAQGRESASGLFPLPAPKSLGQPTLQGPPLACGQPLDQRTGLHKASPVAVPWAFKVELARYSVLLPSQLQSTESNCQTSGTSAVLAVSLPFHSFRG